MAGHALGLEGCIAATPIVDVAALAGHLQMGALQGQAGALMDLESRHHLESLQGMAPDALRTQGGAVHVEMARSAFSFPRFGRVEAKVLVTGDAGQLAVLSFEGEARDRGMLEGGLVLDGTPTLRGVAVPAPHTLRQGAVAGLGPAGLPLESRARNQERADGEDGHPEE